jgi:phosphorylcholine metabolism protein LicD
MCEKNIDLEQKEFANEQECQQESEVSMEELMSSMTLQPLELDISNLDGIQYDNDEFAKGIKETSFIAGQITALLNVGLTSAQAIDFLINEKTILHNLSLAKVNNKTSIEVSKNQALQIQNQQL